MLLDFIWHIWRQCINYHKLVKQCNIASFCQLCRYHVTSRCLWAVGCTSQLDVALILDRSDYLETDPSSWVVSIAKQLVYGLPVESGRTHVALVTYGDNVTINFELNRFSQTADMLNAMSFGYMGQRSHLQVGNVLALLLSNTIYSCVQGPTAQHGSFLAGYNDLQFLRASNV